MNISRCFEQSKDTKKLSFFCYIRFLQKITFSVFFSFFSLELDKTVLSRKTLPKSKIKDRWKTSKQREKFCINFNEKTHMVLCAADNVPMFVYTHSAFTHSIVLSNASKVSFIQNKIQQDFERDWSYFIEKLLNWSGKNSLNLMLELNLLITRQRLTFNSWRFLTSLVMC